MQWINFTDNFNSWPQVQDFHWFHNETGQSFLGPRAISSFPILLIRDVPVFYYSLKALYQTIIRSKGSTGNQNKAHSQNKLCTDFNGKERTGFSAASHACVYRGSSMALLSWLNLLTADGDKTFLVHMYFFYTYVIYIIFMHNAWNFLTDE